MGFPLSVAHIWSRSETLVIVALANEISDQGKVGAVLAKWWLVVPMIWSLATDRPTDRLSPTVCPVRAQMQMYYQWQVMQRRNERSATKLPVPSVASSLCPFSHTSILHMPWWGIGWPWFYVPVVGWSVGCCKWLHRGTFNELRRGQGLFLGPFNVLIFAVFRKVPSATRGTNTKYACCARWHNIFIKRKYKKWIKFFTAFIAHIKELL